MVQRNTETLWSTRATCAGDGAGILVSIPESFLIRVTAELGIDLPPCKYYGVGMVYLPTDETLRNQVKSLMMEVRSRTLHLLTAGVLGCKRSASPCWLCLVSLRRLTWFGSGIHSHVGVCALAFTL